MYVFMQFIDPDAMDKMMVVAEETLMDKGFSDEQIEMQMGMSEKFMTPGFVSIMTIPTFTFFGFLFALITSAILKKEGDPFQTDMQQIDDTEE